MKRLYCVFISLLVIRLLVGPEALAATSYTFPTLNPGGLTGGGSAYTASLNVSGLPSAEYLFVSISADYTPGAFPHDAWSSTLQMELNNGGSTVYWRSSGASYGVLPGAGSTALKWVGQLSENSYQGATPLTIKFVDPFNDASGPYYSTLSNVKITIYPAPAPKYTFATLNPGVLTGGGPAYTGAFNVSGLSSIEYLFVNVSADYTPGAFPHDAWSSTLQMELNNGGSTVYWRSSGASYGVLPGAGSTALKWVGQLAENSYQGATPLTIKFVDPFNDASGPYYSTLSNVKTTIYPAPAPKYTFATLNPGVITGGGAAYTASLNVSGMPSGEYLFVNVSADYTPGASPNDAWSSSMQMELNNGGSTVYWRSSSARYGVLPGAGGTSLKWVGMLAENSYQGATPLTIKFVDPYNDASGPYYSTLSNVKIAIYPAADLDSTPPTVNGNIAVPANGSYRAGQALSFTLTFSENVTVTGTDSTLGLTIGATARTAAYASKTANSVTYSYTIQAGETDTDGIAVGAVTLNASTIADAAGNNANLSLTGHVPSTTGILVDTTAPTIVISTPSATVTKNGPVSYTVTYGDLNFSASTLSSGDVTLNKTSTADGSVSISGSDSTRTVTISGITGSGTLGISIAAGTATDSAGNTAPGAGPSATFTVNTPPAITGCVSGQAANDNSTLTPFASVTIADADIPAQTLALSVALDLAAKGSFTAGSLSASGFANAGGGTYTYGGTALAATTALRALVFAPASNRVPRGSTETTTFVISVSDGLVPATVDSSTTVITTSVNHPPTAAADTVFRYAAQDVKVAVATLLANDSDPDSDGLSITGVTTPTAKGATVVARGKWVFYTPPAGLLEPDTFHYTVADSFGGSAQGSVTVNIKTDDNPSLNHPTIQDLGGGAFRITFDGIPGRTYTIQYSASLSPPAWHSVGNATANAQGIVEFYDSAGSSSGYYRTAYP
jgi:hypothetical protein